jgi:nicotinamide mononucleotide transporter
VSLTEFLGFITGVANVWLLVRQVLWNWPIGIANNLLYFAVFVRSGLYGDAGLQLVYAAMAGYGWWTWSHPAPGKEALTVTRTSRATWTWLVPATALAAVGLSFFLRRFTDSTVPNWDALTTALSLAATYGQTKKLLESWWIWILVDVIYIPLYIYKGLWLTSALYAAFMILCVVGLRSWQKALPHSGSTASVTI